LTVRNDRTTDSESSQGGKALLGLSSQSSLLEQGQLQQAAQGRVQIGFEYLQE